MESTHPSPSNEQILAFWAWFETIAQALGDDRLDATLLADLDARVSELGTFAWELGPGSRAENAFAISPDGVAELMTVTLRVVSMAPTVPRWEFLPARPVRVPGHRFSIDADAGGRMRIDAQRWRYVLFSYPDGKSEIMLEQNDLLHATDNERYVATIILLDGVLGEAVRLMRICGVEPVVALPSELEGKASSINVLADHLESFD